MVKKNSLISFEVKLSEMRRDYFERALEELCESGLEASDCHINGECQTWREKALNSINRFIKTHIWTAT